VKNINNVKRNCRAAKNTENIRDMALGLGADLVGIADTSLLEGVDVFLPYLFDCFPYAISIAISVEKFGRDPEKIYSSIPSLNKLFLKVICSKMAYPLENVCNDLKTPISKCIVDKTSTTFWHTLTYD